MRKNSDAIHALKRSISKVPNTPDTDALVLNAK